jgi:prevent-host-death family protein
MWKLQDAKNRFSEVVDKALTEGPQIVSRRGKEAVVVMSIEEYRRPKRGKLSAFLRKSPLSQIAEAIERDRDTGRSVDL